MSRTPVPRLYVLSRPESERAVVLRRGPTNVFCTIGWDLGTDTFNVGQWCRHRIYPWRCDISPDGEWMSYFALNAKWSSATKGTWFALSRAPYLKALLLWPVGSTWAAGRYIYKADQLPSHWSHLEPTPPLPGDVRVCSGLPRDRLERDGWQHLRDEENHKWFEKAWGRRWRLYKKVNPRDDERHQLRHDHDEPIDLPDWEWADVDGRRDRLVWAMGGQIYASQSHRDPIGESVVIFDARPMKFERIKAPYDDETVLMS